MAYGVTNVNKHVKAGNGLGPRTVIVKVAKNNITQAELDTMAQALTQGGSFGSQEAANDAFTIAGVTSDGANGAFVAGTSDAVWFALQGTGTINADASNALGVTGAALTVEVTFDQA